MGVVADDTVTGVKNGTGSAELVDEPASSAKSTTFEPNGSIELSDVTI